MDTGWAELVVTVARGVVFVGAVVLLLEAVRRLRLRRRRKPHIIELDVQSISPGMAVVAQMASSYAHGESPPEVQPIHVAWALGCCADAMVPVHGPRVVAEAVDDLDVRIRDGAFDSDGDDVDDDDYPQVSPMPTVSASTVQIYQGAVQALQRRGGSTLRLTDLVDAFRECGSERERPWVERAAATYLPSEGLAANGRPDADCGSVFMLAVGPVPVDEIAELVSSVFGYSQPAAKYHALMAQYGGAAELRVALPTGPLVAQAAESASTKGLYELRFATELPEGFGESVPDVEMLRLVESDARHP